MRVALYTRVSTERQSIEGYSLEAQHDQLISYINVNSMQLFKVYTDPGVSAKDLKRSGVQEMIRDLNSGMFDAVIVHKLDRLTRNISDLYNLVELFNDKNVQLISLSENIDTSNPMGRMFVFLLGIFAQMFRENLGEEVTKGMRKRAENGLHSVTVNLYGYERGESGELLIKEEEAKWVRYIFEMYVSGIGSATIAKNLNAMGIRQNKGAKWDPRKALNVINNKHYIGLVHWKSTKDSESTVRKGIHEPIVSNELFERAQILLSRRNEGLRSRNSYEYVFGGIVRCGICGGRYKGKYNGKKDTLIRKMYVCTNNEKYGTCSQSGVSEIKLTQLVFNSISLIGKDYTRKDITKEVLSEEEEIKNSIRLSEERRERWQLAYGDGNMPYIDFGIRMKEEMIQLKLLEEKLSLIPKQITSRLNPGEAVKMIDDLKENWDSLEQSTRKEIMQSLFQEIIIRKENKVWHVDSIVLA